MTTVPVARRATQGTDRGRGGLSRRSERHPGRRVAGIVRPKVWVGGVRGPSALSIHWPSRKPPRGPPFPLRRDEWRRGAAVCIRPCALLRAQGRFSVARGSLTDCPSLLLDPARRRARPIVATECEGRHRKAPRPAVPSGGCFRHGFRKAILYKQNEAELATRNRNLEAIRNHKA